MAADVGTLGYNNDSELITLDHAHHALNLDYDALRERAVRADSGSGGSGRESVDNYLPAFELIESEKTGNVILSRPE